mgnify:CR=1 FL=1
MRQIVAIALCFLALTVVGQVAPRLLTTDEQVIDNSTDQGGQSRTRVFPPDIIDTPQTNFINGLVTHNGEKWILHTNELNALTMCLVYSVVSGTNVACHGGDEARISVPAETSFTRTALLEYLEVCFMKTGFVKLRDATNGLAFSYREDPNSGLEGASPRRGAAPHP